MVLLCFISEHYKLAALAFLDRVGTVRRLDGVDIFQYTGVVYVLASSFDFFIVFLIVKVTSYNFKGRWRLS